MLPILASHTSETLLLCIGLGAIAVACQVAYSRVESGDWPTMGSDIWVLAVCTRRHSLIVGTEESSAALVGACQC